MRPNPTPNDTPIGEILAREGLVSKDQIEQALALQAREGGRICQHLIRLGFVSAEALTRFFQSYFGFVPFRLDDIVIDKSLPQLITAEVARFYRIIPIERSENTLRVAFCEGASEISRVCKALKELTSFDIEPIFSPEPLVLEALDNHYGSAKEKGVYWKNVGENLFVLQDTEEGIQPLALNTLTAEASEIDWLRAILAHAIKLKTRDVHIEAGDKGYEVFIGENKEYSKILVINPAVERNLLVFIKRLVKYHSQGAGPSEWSSPRAAIQIDKRHLTLEAHFLSTSFGERIILKLLDETHLKIHLTGVFRTYPDSLLWAQTFAEGQKGLWLLTGPADGTKRQFYYAVLEDTSKSKNRLFSVEQRLFAHIRGTQQLETGVQRTLAETIGNALEQHPDALAIYEIEDTRDAERAFFVSARLPVLATLTSYDAFSALEWLIQRKLLSPIKAGLLRGVLAVRSFDALCAQCAEPYHPKPADEERLAELGYKNTKFFANSGCPLCADPTIRKRTVIVETLEIDDRTGQFLAAPGANCDALRDERLREGAPTLLRRALELASARAIDIRPVLAVLTPH